MDSEAGWLLFGGLLLLGRALLGGSLGEDLLDQSLVAGDGVWLSSDNAEDLLAVASGLAVGEVDVVVRGFLGVRISLPWLRREFYEYRQLRSCSDIS